MLEQQTYLNVFENTFSQNAMHKIINDITYKQLDPTFQKRCAHVLVIISLLRMYSVVYENVAFSFCS